MSSENRRANNEYLPVLSPSAATRIRQLSPFESVTNAPSESSARTVSASTAPFSSNTFKCTSTPPFTPRTVLNRCVPAVSAVKRNQCTSRARVRLRFVRSAETASGLNALRPSEERMISKLNASEAFNRSSASTSAFSRTVSGSAPDATVSPACTTSASTVPSENDASTYSPVRSGRKDRLSSPAAPLSR